LSKQVGRRREKAFALITGSPLRPTSPVVTVSILFCVTQTAGLLTETAPKGKN
jgi:hypothetical protein